MEMFVAFVLIWICLGALGMYVSSQKGRGSAEGCLFTLFLGPLGILIVALLPTREVNEKNKGTYCSSPEYEAIKQDAMERLKIKKASRGD